MTRLKIAALPATCIIVMGAQGASGVLAQSDDSKETKAVKPLQGYAAVDSKGTPLVPPWKIEEGVDAFVGKFYVGMVGVKLMAVDGPPPAAVLTGKQLEKWRGKKPFPCVIRFTKLMDESGGYYFQCLGYKDGPQGWIIPLKSMPEEGLEAQPGQAEIVIQSEKKEKKEKKSWSLYFRQEKISD